MSDTENEAEEEQVTEEAPKLETKRIFINHVDSYHGKNLAKVNNQLVLKLINNGKIIFFFFNVFCYSFYQNVLLVHH